MTLWIVVWKSPEEVASEQQSGCKRPLLDSKVCWKEASNGNSYEALKLRSLEAKAWPIKS
jgi:hypothetical protein